MVHGPTVHVPRAAVLPLGTALCELATNAVKYGALSSNAGSVDISWTLTRVPPSEAGDDVRLDLVWAERNGPRVEPPQRRGYGSSLLERGVASALGGVAQLDFAPEGLTCCMTIPFRAAELGASVALEARALVSETREPCPRLPESHAFVHTGASSREPVAP